MSPAYQLQMTLAGISWGASGVIIRLMNDRQLIRLEGLVELFDEERGANTRVRGRYAV